MQQVKNIAEPVHVFRVLPSAARRPSVATAPHAALPDKPSVAVLPFTNMSADPDQEYFADGIAEDIITALSRFPSLFVIARNSSFTYKGRAVDVKQVGRELGVRYVLEGSLRKAGNRIRVTAQLIEATTGTHVWADRYDRDLADIFAVQDEITTAVTVAIAPAIADAELQRAMRKPPGSLDAWGAYQRGLWHLGQFNADHTTLAERFFEQAIELDPAFAGGYSGLAAAQLQAANTFMQRDLAETLRSAENTGAQGGIPRRRRCRCADLPRARAGTKGDYQGALAAIEQAITLNPNLAIAHGTLGGMLVFSGRPEQGLVALERGIRLDPRHPRAGVLLNQFVIGLYFLRDYEGAVEAARRVLRSYPEHPLVYRWLAAALGQLGRIDEARQALEQAMSLSPAAFDFYVRRRVPWHREEDHQHMLDGLRKAGWQG